VAVGFPQIAQQSRAARTTAVMRLIPAKSLYEKCATVGEMEQTRSTPVADTKGERAGADSMACMRPVAMSRNCYGERAQRAADHPKQFDVRKRLMARSHLRVYYGPVSDVQATIAESKQGDTVTVALSEVLPLLADAVRNERTWLADFDNDPITISTDLYEVILAYQHYRRPSA
jgi:hypothetical protein